jgi:hypothetical protein
VPNYEAVGGPGSQQRPSKKQNPFNEKFEDEKDDSMQIADKPMAEQLFGDNSSSMGQIPDKGQVIQADKLDQFLSQNEKERASTIYKQMQQLREESLCMLCN